jgi:hypothetical protein
MATAHELHHGLLAQIRPAEHRRTMASSPSSASAVVAGRAEIRAHLDLLRHGGQLVGDSRPPRLLRHARSSTLASAPPSSSGQQQQ